MLDLEGRVDWLRVGKWQTNSDFAIGLDFQVSHGGEDFSLQMIYPSVFPDAPPMVYTEDRSRISHHQYGADGELCLEHRPDNWLPSITGADMVASCHRLIVEERPETGKTEHARSAHVESLGRSLRSNSFRFLMTEANLEAVNALPEYTPETLVFHEHKTFSTFIVFVNHIGTEDTPIWTSDLAMTKAGRDSTGYVVRAPGLDIQDDIKPEGLRALLDSVNLCEFAKIVFDTNAAVFVLIRGEENWALFWIHGDTKDRKLIAYSTVHVLKEKQRLPNGFGTLAEKKVAIIGCGSVGSKIAASLCRSGVGGFLLIDEDMFFPGNVVRNELDLSGVGEHKSYALRDRLLKLNPRSDIMALRIAIGGQESAKSMTDVLEALGRCDLLVDASANPTAFNLVASVSTRKRKPIVWAEVFAGGIGGLVARARPDIDPVPLLARGQIEVWCNDQGVEWIRPMDTDRYTGQSSDGQPLIADDAEVALIASHATRFATDILSRPNASIFPMSAYIVGFSSEWLFDQPFHTLPIDLKPDGIWGETIDTLEPEVALELLKEHLPSNGF